jgi:ATP-dependent DNA helicase PIF1
MTQDEAFTILTMGKNVFLTGAAGSGKTYVLNRYIAWLRARGVEPAITASTGIASTHVGGQTIHSWSGVGVKKYLGPYELEAIAQNERLVKRFRATSVLIIDEVSMLSADMLTMVDQSIRTGLQSTEPFGGMQVILCGDFFQLPPVSRGGSDALFAFQSESWHQLSLHICYLSEQYRQDDTVLLAILNSIRTGEVSNELRLSLESRLGVVPDTNVPHLYTHNIDVDRLNIERLATLPGAIHTYEMRSKGSRKHVELLKKGSLAVELLQLKEGASVMCVKNHPQGTYVNGTLGTVTGFTAMGDPIVKTHTGKTLEVEVESWKLEDGDKVRAELLQIPLRLAWAVTVHKSQGLTLDAARMDLQKTFVEGQGYVALSRVRSLEGLYLEGISDLAYSRHPAVAEADKHFVRISDALVRRLAKTPPVRVQEIASEFLRKIGGKEPDGVEVKGTRGRKSKENTYDKTLHYVREHRSISEIAEARGYTEETVIAHLEQLLRTKKIESEEIEYLLPTDGYDEVLEEVAEAFRKSDTWNLGPVRSRLSYTYSYEEIRFARLFVRDWREE